MSAADAGHSIAIDAACCRVVVRLGGEVVADSREALVLRETGYPPVYYLPRADVRADCLTASPRRSHCPFKGEAGYWNLAAGGLVSEDAAWSYERPIGAVAPIAGRLAFFAQRVEAIEAG